MGTINTSHQATEIYPLLADITRLKADVIVNSANASLLAGSGVCGAIHNLYFFPARRAGACDTCGGARLKTESLLWRIGSKQDADAVLDPAQRFLMMQSAPVVIPSRANGAIAVTVK